MAKYLECWTSLKLTPLTATPTVFSAPRPENWSALAFAKSSETAVSSAQWSKLYNSFGSCCRVCHAASDSQDSDIKIMAKTGP